VAPGAVWNACITSAVPPGVVSTSTRFRATALRVSSIRVPPSTVIASITTTRLESRGAGADAAAPLPAPSFAPKRGSAGKSAAPRRQSAAASCARPVRR
jgi:hypothetical protein